MRDDLHRTVPVTRAWRPVLQYASREADWGRFPAAIERAVREETVALMSPSWLQGLEAALSNTTPDMFGLDRVSGIIDAFEHGSTTATEAQLCETMRGISARDGDVAHLFRFAMSELCKQSTDAHIEQVGALIRRHLGPWEAARAMKRMRFLANGLTFDMNDAKPRRRSKPSDRALLDTALEIQGVV